MENAIEIKGLNKSFGDFALKNVNITLPKGYIMGFIGANGAGKSTTINAILNLIKKDSGEIFVLGKEHTSLSMQDKADIGVVLDECCFSETLSRKDISKILQNIYSNWDGEKFEALTKHFSIPPLRKIKEYSKGMKMKLSIAVALCHNAKLLILDEATSGLDPIVRDEILDILLEFVQDEEHSVLLSSHITRDLEKVCDYITFIKNGEIVFSQTKDDIMEKYALLRCKNDDFAQLDRDCVIGYRQNSFATDALVLRERMGDNFILDKASIEDIMLYYIKEGK
ncbi:MAG: ABC transporter ATP-binding protein [Oscillospiraceae bacterium]